jgi:hypothetical protein
MKYNLSRRVAADLFEGEYIIANLDTGLYYSLQGAGIFLLKNLPFEAPEELMTKFYEAFSPDKEVVEKDLSRIWTALVEEGIVVPVEGQSEKGDVELPEVFEPSTFNSYADMQDLLALDPIHEVDEEGWEKKGENESK